MKFLPWAPSIVDAESPSALDDLPTAGALDVGHCLSTCLGKVYKGYETRNFLFFSY